MRLSPLCRNSRGLSPCGDAGDSPHGDPDGERVVCCVIGSAASGPRTPCKPCRTAQHWYSPSGSRPPSRGCSHCRASSLRRSSSRLLCSGRGSYPAIRRTFWIRSRASGPRARRDRLWKEACRARSRYSRGRRPARSSTRYSILYSPILSKNCILSSLLTAISAAARARL